jgi:hypothetical protein
MEQTKEYHTEGACKTRGKQHSLRSLINAKCRECIYDPLAEGNWRQQVGACTSPSCPLFEVRPRSKPHKPKEQHGQ